MKRYTAILCLLFALTGCAAYEPSVPTEPSAVPTAVATEPPVTMPPAVEAEAAAMEEAPPPAVSVVLQAQPSGEREARCEDAVIDFSNTADGYVMARYLGQTDKRLKFRVIGPGTTYTYNLPVDQWTVFPLSDGNGSYQTTGAILCHAG